MTASDFADPRYLITPLELSACLSEVVLIAVCHGGYRSARTFLALESLGYPRVRNYVSSWGEWGKRDDARIVLAQSDH